MTDEDNRHMEARAATAAFARANKMAMLMQLQATQDYASARCLLLNGLPDGLVIGAQSIEKFLKAFILFNEPDFDYRKSSHKLPGLLEEASKHNTGLMHFAASAQKFLEHYNTRYPDNANTSRSKSTAELADLDVFIMRLAEIMPIPGNVKARSGIQAEVMGDAGHPKARWIKERNGPLEKLMPEIIKAHESMMEALYPLPTMLP